MSKWLKFALLFLFLFAFRTAFGLSQPFFSPDELQTYLIGLKAYTDHLWPFFGPDLIVTETGFYAQIPGALEGLMIGLPFYLLPIPEAPFLFLNLLSLSALACLSYYIAKRVPEISFYFIFAWLALLPWNLHESTNIINPSWLLFGGVFFFIGFLEALPDTSLKVISPGKAFALMGFGLFWCIQFHYSWVLLPPFIAIAFFWRWRLKQLGPFPEMAGLALGSLASLAFLIPTLIQYGSQQAAGGMGLSVGFNVKNFLAFFVVLARFFSLPSYELPRFLGAGTGDRLQFLREIPWIKPAAWFLFIVGILQACVLFIMLFFKDKLHRDGKTIHGVTAFALLLVWASFWFTSKPPQAHMYYILLPLISVYSFYVWGWLAVKRPWRIFGMVCLIASVWFELAYMVHQMPVTSLYANRPLVAKAVTDKNYHLMGERRPGSHN